MGFFILAVKEYQAETTPGDCFNGLRGVESNLAIHAITTMDGSRVLCPHAGSGSVQTDVSPHTVIP